MPAALDSSMVPGLDMFSRSHKTNANASDFVRTSANDFSDRYAQSRNMARRGIPNQVNWYLKEWMDMLGVKQADMIRLTDWSKATMSQLYNNKQDYSPKIVNEASRALKVATYELLMPPERAMALRRLHQDALRIVQDVPPTPPPEAKPAPKVRRAAGKKR